MPACAAVLLSPSSGLQAAAIQVGLTLVDALRFEMTRPPLVSPLPKRNRAPIRL